MRKKVILLYIFITFLIMSLIVRSDISSTELWQTDPTSAVNQISQTPIPTEDLTTQITGTGKIGQVTPGSTGSLSSGVNLQDIIGSYDVLVVTGKVIGGVIVSPKDNNAVTTFNPLTGDVIVYHMGRGNSVVIDYLSEPGSYTAEMKDEDIIADIEKKNSRVKFTAHSGDSVLIIRQEIKNTPSSKSDGVEPSPEYEFKDGLLEYENDDIVEKVNTSKTDSAVLDSDYETGFGCVVLSPESNYDYFNKEEKEKSFSIKNENNKDYTVCMKKTAYDKYSLESNLYSSLLDVMNDDFLLKAKTTFSKEYRPVYKSFDVKNLARVESDVETTKLSLENKAPGTKLISEVYTGIYKITETMVRGIAHRGFDYSQERKPVLINLYTSNIGKAYNYGGIKITKNGALHYYSLDGEEKIIMHDPETVAGKKCKEQLKEVLTYEHSIETELEHLEKC